MANDPSYYDERFLWKSGSSCSVYSRSNKKWYKAVINNIFIDAYTHKEWFIVKYNYTQKKYIQRLCKHIKPISNNIINTVWIIGKNQFYECGQTLRSPDDDDTRYYNDDTGDYCKKLTLCKWSLLNNKFANVCSISRGFGFNIFSMATRRDELIVFGFIQSIQSILAAHNIYIPNRIYLKVLLYFGQTYNQYYSVGNNDFGELGIGHNNFVGDKVTAIPSFGKAAIFNIGIIKICTGSAARNICWITNNGELYIHGQNLQKYQNKKTDEAYADGFEPDEEQVSLPTEWRYFREKKLNCSDGASSYFHCMIVSDDGSVWSLGKGNYGELGHGANQHLFTDNFVKIKALNKYNIIGVACGSYFSLFVSDEGDVWSCGSNKYGQCGLGFVDQDKNRLPQRIEYFVEEDIEIKKIECGLYHCVALDVDGYVYVWGRNNIGQCAKMVKGKYDKTITVPRLVHQLMEYQVMEVKTGCNHSLAVTENNDYYMWGCNDFNECCVEGSVGVVVRPHCINAYVDEVTKSHEIIDITLGSCNTVVIVRGENRY